ncbi:hypothetical protein PIB30_030249 [Stylosanthes scabra]|uniref:Uncharacterized protein n=1 Tax=Stylosanthes scabra TaxID=79078 RepID=A0ABU6XCE0_9FABA|nr:hypothetical protein [Stylosanthes scabra]
MIPRGKPTRSHRTTIRHIDTTAQEDHNKSTHQARNVGLDDFEATAQEDHNKSTHQARNVELDDFEATVQDIGLRWPKFMIGSSKPHHYPAPHLKRPTASLRGSIRDRITLIMISNGFLPLLILSNKST